MRPNSIKVDWILIGLRGPVSMKKTLVGWGSPSSKQTNKINAVKIFTF